MTTSKTVEYSRTPPAADRESPIVRGSAPDPDRPETFLNPGQSNARPTLDTE